MEAYDYSAMREQDERGKITAAEKKGGESKEMEVVLEMHTDGVPLKTIAKYLKTTEERIVEIIESHRSK